jgi:hypothetical protein
MQRIYNYGSFLQAFALKHILEDLGASVEFVDYHSGETLEQSDQSTGIVRKIKRVSESFQLHTSLKTKVQYIRYKRNFARNYFPYLQLTEVPNYQPSVDLLVIGSDEVFNCVQDNVNVGFSPELFGQGNRAKRLISYAASFGNTTLEKLQTHKVSDKVAGWLKDFDGISVRDQNSVEVVTKLLGTEPLKNIDPVLAFDYMNEANHIPDSVPYKSKYLLLYGYTGRFSREECEQIKSFARAKNLKIMCIGGLQHCCDVFVDCSPFEVIAYFKAAEVVVTDTFHGTILSVITHQKFATVIRKSGYGNSEKLTDLLQTLGLMNQIATDISMISEVSNQVINYGLVDKIIDQQRKHSYEYLFSQINAIETK